MNSQSPQVILCSGAILPDSFGDVGTAQVLYLEYEKCRGGPAPNVKIALQDFVRDLNYLPVRVRDLLEIAAYVYAADRLVSRGASDLLEYHSWSRRMHFVVKVRDPDFWDMPATKRALSEALTFMTGDLEYEFTFRPGRTTTAASLFDREEFLIEPERASKIVLFSGGLDSLAGVIDDLENTEACLYLVSHRSHQPSTTKTQDALVNALQERYQKERVRHYKFYCSLRDIRARDENQRSRAFLYTSIAYALACALRQSDFTIYENGVTALNFPKREDMQNARASRTAHPRTIRLLETFLSLVAETQITIHTPLMWKTKADVLQTYRKNAAEDLISSAVSCSKTFQNAEMKTHCGQCSQCVDRRLSAYATSLEDFDHAGLYTLDFTRDPLEGENKTLYLDYVRWARYFARCSPDDFCQKMINELADVYECVGLDEENAIFAVYDLHRRHGKEIETALKRLVDLYYDPFDSLPQGSFLKLLFEDKHLQTPVQGLADDVCRRLERAIPIMFQRNPPKNENDLNDKVEAILAGESEAFAREYPTVSLALAKAVPDHSANGQDLLIESKYLRESTTPSVASEGISADLTKYPSDSYLLFVVYDPHRSIVDDEKFARDFEAKRPGKCRVMVIR